MRSAFGCLVVAGALLVSSPVQAEDEKNTAPAGGKSEAAAEKPSPREAPKVIVAVDPDTGKLRAATAAEREALRAGAKKALAGPLEPTLVERLPDGRVRARLGPEQVRYSVVRVNPDGTLSAECVPAGKAGSVSGAAAPPAPAPSAPAPAEK
ncbi:MAG TPA: hypothetical protein VL084_03390 [Thermoanaerobaculia bacterium]|nr:hypothetical protein [Thermoanaerobaculia bacterium]